MNAHAKVVYVIYNQNIIMFGNDALLIENIKDQ